MLMFYFWFTTKGRPGRTNASASDIEITPRNSDVSGYRNRIESRRIERAIEQKFHPT
jgi:hypothetical protein